MARGAAPAGVAAGSDLGTRGDDHRGMGTAAFLALAYSALVVAIFMTMVVPLLPSLRDTLHVSTAEVSWVLTANFMAASVCAPLLGRFGDMFGKRRSLTAALVLLASGSLVAATTSSFGVLIVARVMQGGATAIIPLGMSIVADEWDGPRVRLGIGWLSSSLAVGAALGMVFAGVIVQVAHDYHLVFWGGTVASLIAIVAVLALVPRSRLASRGRIDVLGALLLTAWLTLLLLAIVQIGERGIADGRVLGMLGIAVALFCVWLAVELRARVPLVDPRQIFERAVLSANLMAICVGFAMYGSLFLVTAFVQTSTSTHYGLGLSVLGTGLLLLPSAGGTFIASQIAGTSRRAPRLVAAVGAVLLSLSLVLMAVVHASFWELAAENALLGFGGGLAFASLPAVIIDAVPAADTGVSTGINMIMRTMGGAVSGAVIAAVLSVAPGSSAAPTESAFMRAFLICGVVGVLAVPLAGLSRTRRSSVVATATLHSRAS